ncbi:MAG TPA: DUF5610 domain-containing protein [Spongiibacteraceae bacterium]|nr:DUF5610 domain-containing protein [Spongiibacteraceae bacterium]
MHIAAPHFGSYRPQSGGLDPFNRHSSSSSPANSATSSANSSNSAAPATASSVTSPTKAAVDLSPVTSVAAGFDSDTVSKNILSFVQQRLTQAQQQGASKDDLAKLLQQARKGAESGFDQAVAQLKGNGSLDDSLSSGISSALQKVDKGFDDLAKQLGLTTDTTAATANPAPAAPTSTLSQLAASYKASFSSKQSVDLLVKTADGDTVHLQLGVNNKQSVRASYQADASGQRLSVSSSQKSSAGLSISVDGDLDQDELQALNDLLDQVGDLADTFFSGDVASAFQQAGALDFNNPELSSLSLNLHSETRVREKVAAYQQVQSLASDDASANGSGVNNNVAAPALSTLSNLADALSALVPQASAAANPASLLKQLLAAQVGAADQQNNPLLNFANRLLTALGADKSSAPITDAPASSGVATPSTTPSTTPATTVSTASLGTGSTA